MAPHSRILAWGILRTEEPGGLTVHGAAKSWTRLSTAIIIWVFKPVHDYRILAMSTTAACLPNFTFGDIMLVA